jgi:hypothetical protein
MVLGMSGNQRKSSNRRREEGFEQKEAKVTKGFRMECGQRPSVASFRQALVPGSFNCRRMPSSAFHYFSHDKSKQREFELKIVALGNRDRGMGVSACRRVAPIASTSLLFLDAQEPPLRPYADTPLRRSVSPGVFPALT